MKRVQIKQMYKIHCIDVGLGLCRSAGNDTFYETEEEAIERARGYVENATTYSGRGMVIYKAHVLIQRRKPPVEILSINRDGQVQLL